MTYNISTKGKLNVNTLPVSSLLQYQDGVERLELDYTSNNPFPGLG